jgi:hypothetical protein
LQEEFDWTRDQVSLAVSINLVFYGLAAPFSAAFVERVGARAVMLVSIAAVGVGAALTTPPDRAVAARHHLESYHRQRDRGDQHPVVGGGRDALVPRNVAGS